MDQHGEQFLNWVKTPRVGCQFARTLARDVDTSKWGGVTVIGDSLGKEEVAVLDSYFAAACGQLEVVHALFPDIKTPAAVARLIQSLCLSPNWKSVEIKVDCPQASQAMLIGLRWFLPDKKHVNYVLGFADFPEMPSTRRAPFTALVLRTGPPGRAPSIAHARGVSPKEDVRKIDLDCIPVHLADAPDLLETEQQVANRWAVTSKLKRRQLKGDLMEQAAKAKITFCLPQELRRLLAPSLTEVVELPVSS